MSDSSYPSPVSTRASPQARERTRNSAETRDPSDTQRNLRQVSASLEAAYQRIRQVRRSLLDLQDNYNSIASRMQDPSIGPNHDAILLTEDTSSERSSIESQLAQFEMAFEAEANAERMSRLNESWVRAPAIAPTDLPPNTLSRNNTVSPINLNSPVSPIRHPFPPRRSLLEVHTSRRRESDDPNTLIGRQVAARQSHQQTVPSDISPQQRYLLQAENTVRELERLSNEYHRRLVGMSELPPLADLSSMEPVLEYPRPTAAEVLSRRSLDANVLQAASQAAPPAQPSQSLMPPRITTTNRRWPRLSRGDTRQSTVQSPASSRSDATRLSILSNLSMNNLSTPLSALNRERPLLFEEPMSYEQADLFPGSMPIRGDPIENIRPDPLGRSYLVRRQINPDGREYVHNISRDANEGDFSWVPSNSQSIQQDPSHYVQPRLMPPPMRPTTDTYTLSPVDMTQAPRTSVDPMGPTPLSRTRRRAWARLDADGNEIPSDEEEELERFRSEQRIRANNAARLSLLAEQAAIAGERRSTMMTGMFMNDGDDVITRRVIHRSRDVMLQEIREINDSGSKLRMKTMQHLPEVNKAKSKPFTSNPLPMPLEDMMPSATHGKPVKRLIVVKKSRMVDDR